MTRRYLVIYETGEKNMSGFAPDVPGCASTGRTLDEMRTNLREAQEFHLEGLSSSGEPIPSATTHSIEVPENGLAEWLAVTLPVPEAVSA
ncbi:MAG TPA: type II toxin-antitoxin system HicB family antitoxin [Acidobacteriaceae bacterium]|nr:type II toxin-antitoxin system HicB family antitoxin [Acidobacteriaceae bacterium]